MNTPHFDKPVLAYNEECPFCRFWVKKWKGITGPSVSYESLEEVSKKVHSISYNQFLGKIHAFTPDGKVYKGAHAVFYILSQNPHYKWLIEWYQKVPLFKKTAELLYGIVSAHRHVLYLTMKFFGAK